jgi:hypothetical protein
MIRSPLRILFDLCWQRVVVVCTSARQVRAFVNFVARERVGKNRLIQRF